MPSVLLREELLFFGGMLVARGPEQNEQLDILSSFQVMIKNVYLSLQNKNKIEIVFGVTDCRSAPEFLLYVPVFIFLMPVHQHYN